MRGGSKAAKQHSSGVPVLQEKAEGHIGRAAIATHQGPSMLAK